MTQQGYMTDEELVSFLSEEGRPSLDDPLPTEPERGDNTELAEAEELFRERPLGVTERLQEAGADFAVGLGGLPTGLVESGGIFGEHVLGMEGAALGARDFADGIRGFIDEIAPGVDKKAADEGIQLAQALGSGVGFLAGGYAGAAAKLPAWAGAAFAGAAVNAAPAYHEALYETGDEDTAFAAWMLNGLVGTSEAWPLARIFGRINKASGGGLRKALIDMAHVGGEEALQEMGQEMAAGIIAEQLEYGERATLEEMLEGGLTGFLSGAILMGLGSSVGRRVQQRREEAEFQTPSTARAASERGEWIGGEQGAATDYFVGTEPTPLQEQMAPVLEASLAGGGAQPTAETGPPGQPEAPGVVPEQQEGTRAPQGVEVVAPEDISDEEALASLEAREARVRELFAQVQPDLTGKREPTAEELEQEERFRQRVEQLEDEGLETAQATARAMEEEIEQLPPDQREGFSEITEDELVEILAGDGGRRGGRTKGELDIERVRMIRERGAVTPAQAEAEVAELTPEEKAWDERVLRKMEELGLEGKEGLRKAEEAVGEEIEAEARTTEERKARVEQAVREDETFFVDRELARDVAQAWADKSGKPVGLQEGPGPTGEKGFRVRALPTKRTPDDSTLNWRVPSVDGWLDREGLLDQPVVGNPARRMGEKAKLLADSQQEPMWVLERKPELYVVLNVEELRRFMKGAYSPADVRALALPSGTTREQWREKYGGRDWFADLAKGPGPRSKVLEEAGFEPLPEAEIEVVNPRKPKKAKPRVGGQRKIEPQPQGAKPARTIKTAKSIKAKELKEEALRAAHARGALHIENIHELNLTTARALGKYLREKIRDEKPKSKPTPLLQKAGFTPTWDKVEPPKITYTRAFTPEAEARMQKIRAALADFIVETEAGGELEAAQEKVAEEFPPDAPGQQYINLEKAKKAEVRKRAKKIGGDKKRAEQLVTTEAAEEAEAQPGIPDQLPSVDDWMKALPNSPLKKQALHAGDIAKRRAKKDKKLQLVVKAVDGFHVLTEADLAGFGKIYKEFSVRAQAIAEGGASAVGFPGYPGRTPEVDAPVVQLQDYIGRGLYGRLARPEVWTKGVNAPQIIDQLAAVARAMGQSGLIRVGTLNVKGALGFYKVFPEITRIRAANDIGTAAHEIGHALDKALHGWPAGGPFKEGTPSALPLSPGWYPKPVQDELMRLGKELYGDTQPAGGYRREGWAEYIRMWVSEHNIRSVKHPVPTGRKTLAENVPNLHAWFTDTFLPAHPRVRVELERARELTDKWRQQGSYERADNSVIDPGSPKERFKAFYRDTRDFFSVQAWVEMGEEIRKASVEAKLRSRVPVPPSEDPFLVYRALRTGHASKVKYMVEKGMLDIAGNVVGPSLDEAVAPIKAKEQQDFMLYLWASQAKLYWEGRIDLTIDPETGAEVPVVKAKPRDPGLSIEDTKQLLSELENPRFAIAKQKIMDWNEGVLNYAAQGSPSFAAVARRIRDAHPGYIIPLQREFRKLDRAYRAGGAKGGSMVKRMKGSARRIKNPISGLVSHANDIVLKTHQRMVLERIINLSNVEGMGHLVEEIPRHRVPSAHRTIEGIMSDVQKRLKEKYEGYKATILNDIGEEIPLRKNKADLEEEENLLGEIITFFAPAQVPKKGEDPILPVYTAGQGVRWYAVPEKLYHALAGMDVYRMSRGMELIAGIPTQVMRAGTTALRPAFALVTNPARDPQTMYVNTQTNASPALLLMEWLKAQGKAFLGVATAGRTLDPWHEAFIRLGGEMTLPLGQDIQHTRRAARKLFHGKVRRLVDPSNIWDYARDLLQFPEQAPRVAEFKLLAKEVGWEPGMPMTLDQAIVFTNAFKQVTTDFSAAGEYARVMNRIAPFHNAGIQGPRANLAAARRNPKRFTGRGLHLTAATIALWFINRDEDWYEEMTPEQKFLFWHIEVGGELIMVPRAFEVGGVFAAFPELMLDSWYRKSPDQAMAWVDQFRKVLSPNVTPVLLDEILDQTGNRDRFWDRPIDPESEKRWYPEDRFNEYTSRTSVALGKLFGISPRRIDHAIRGVGGGAASDAIGAAEDLASVLGLAKKPSKKREGELADLWVIGKLFRRGGAMGNRPVTIERLYEKLNEAQAIQLTPSETETPRQRENRLLLSDAAQAVSALSYVRSQTSSKVIRRKTLEEARQIALDALRAIELDDLGFERYRFRAAKKETKAREDAKRKQSNGGR